MNSEQAESLPSIGIFWVYQGRVFGRTSSISEGYEAVPGRIDAEETHAQVWEEENHFAELFPELADLEYLDVPRGRVLFQTNTRQPRIYLDGSLMQHRVKQKIADFFGFAYSRAIWCADLHYTTNPDDLERLFND